MKKINSHIIQRALAKNFSINGVIKSIIYGTDEKFEFTTEKEDHQKPIAKIGFYSEEIEKGMNDLEATGIQVINQAVIDINNNKPVILKRKNLMALKYFCLLTSMRTEKYRRNIKNLDGDSTFNEVMRKTNKSSKEIQEEQMKVLLKSFAENRLRPGGTVEKRINEVLYKSFAENNDNFNQDTLLEHFKNNLTIETAVLINVQQVLQSKCVFVKFEKNKLFMQEANAFTESTKNGGIMYQFTTISPNTGVILYFDPLISRGLVEKETPIVFDNDIKNISPKTEYVNMEKMKTEQIKYIKEKIISGDKRHPDIINREFWVYKAPKYQTKNDLYIYTPVLESEDVADKCNAMALVHNYGNRLIYQHESHIKDAEEKIAELGIFRIEDYV